MKLSQVIRRYFLLSLLLIIVLGTISTYFIYTTLIHHPTDQILCDYKDRVENYIKQNDSLVIFNTSVFYPQRLNEQIIAPTDHYFTGLKDTLLYNEMSGEFQPYRQLYFTVEYGDQLHLITLNQSVINIEDLLYVNVALLISIIILILIFIYAIEYYLKKNVWNPFSKMIDKLRSYHFGIGETLDLEESNISEFEELNQVMNKMIIKINSDFENVKNFSEDISHEMQTPLSIVRSKLELLRQKVPLGTPDYINSITAMYQSISRLSKLNKSLLLLTRIQNNQYSENINIDLSIVIDDYLEEFNELIVAKNILLTSDLESLRINIDPNLVDILISNLISNSIRHNHEGGYIRVNLKDNSLKIENSYTYIVDESNDLFKRMTKGNLEESTGLGLNIVKTICDQYNYDIHYSYSSSDTFRIVLIFK